MSRQILQGVSFSQGAGMRAIAIFVAIFAGLVAAILFSLILPGIESRARQDKWRARSLADAKMNARLLRLNL
jgi:hypothetical protein